MARIARYSQETKPDLSDEALAKYGQEWIRTTEGVKPADLQSAPFGHFGTYPERSFAIHGCLFSVHRWKRLRRRRQSRGAVYIGLWIKPCKRILENSPTRRRAFFWKPKNRKTLWPNPGCNCDL